MEGVFDPEKKRFYAEVGELLIAMPHRGATRHLQLTIQLVGHDQKYMKSVDNDVPAIRNGLLIFFNQQEFENQEWTLQTSPDQLALEFLEYSQWLLFGVKFL